ncbi:unnamed protein product [Linum trigynum]|uniref:Gnk2-homologous domain-containing protein n=1 Tax=Linum trigynum TaxID=586398 RepID=A0AAV2D593_9ROSI
MAIIRLLLSLSVTFPLIITAVDAVGDDNYHTKCFDGNGGGAAAVRLMQSLSQDLVDKVPGKDPRLYCNVQTTGSGLQMYGYAYCMTDSLSGNVDPATACTGCLTSARNLLIDGCQETGSGQVIGEHDHCYIWIGFGGCPDND